MTRAVFDTNVLVSVAVFGGVPYECLRLAARRTIILVLSPVVLEEFRRVLRAKLRYTDQEIKVREDTIRQVASMMVEPQERITAVAEDVADNRILEAGLLGQADVIVTGDRHLHKLRSFRGIPILTPRQFLVMLSKEKEI